MLWTASSHKAQLKRRKPEEKPETVTLNLTNEEVQELLKDLQKARKKKAERKKEREASNSVSFFQSTEGNERDERQMNYGEENFVEDEQFLNYTFRKQAK